MDPRRGVVRDRADSERTGDRRQRGLDLAFDEWVVAHARISKKPHRGAKLEDTLTFFHQLATLVNSGTPLLQALKIATSQCESVKLRGVLSQITAKVSAGSTFHAAAACFPQVFEFQWLEAIRTGEVTGKMAQVLTELNKQIRDARETKKKVKGALMYPMVLIVVAVTAVTVMLWMVVPVFAKMFKDMDAQLPGITQFVVDASESIKQYGPYVIVGLIVGIFAFRRFMKTESGRRYVGGALMVLPSVGQLVIGMAMYRFSSNLSLLLKSGVPMMETMYTLTGIFQTNPIYRDALARVSSRVAAGKPLHAALAETGLFLPMLTSMVQVGEESGQLAQVMEQISPFFKEKMEGMVLKVTKMVEPIIIMGMGSSIAGLMLAIYMPMFEMAGNVK
jgi:type IV pilus assembly protein PilC